MLTVDNIFINIIVYNCNYINNYNSSWKDINILLKEDPSLKIRNLKMRNSNKIADKEKI